MHFYRTDAKSIWLQTKRQGKHLKLKRRWLMGIRPTQHEMNKLNKMSKNRFLSESLLRDDDIFYESARAHVERAFGAPCVEPQNHLPHDDIHLIHVSNKKLKKLILSCLHSFTIKGLYLVAMIITGGSVKSEITRCNLKKIIKASLSSVLGRRSHSLHLLETRKQLLQLLSNPRHFQARCEPLSALKSQSYHADVAMVLDRLKGLPTQTLDAMRRKLKGEKAPIPQLQIHKKGWNRDHLIKIVKKISREMLSQLHIGNELQEPLAKAMAVADLSLKLTTGCHSIFSREFYQFPPEVKSLQNDIMNAIQSVEKVVAVPSLRDLQLLIEPEATIPSRRLRTAFAHFLTEYLFECSDMNSIPKSLSQILDIVNQISDSTHEVLFQKKYVEEDVDCILNLSAHTKQVVLDLLPDHEFDEDFTDAYMEQLEESDDSGSDEDDDVDSQLQEDRQFINGTFNSMDSNYEAESIGDFVPFELHHCTSITEENVSFCPLTISGRLNFDSEKLKPKSCVTANLDSEAHSTPHNSITNQLEGESKEHFGTRTASKNFNASAVSPDRDSNENVVIERYDLNESDTQRDQRDTANLFCEETGPILTKDSVCKNPYLAIQDSCDKMSMLAYNLIGHMLEEFAIIEGLDLKNRRLYLSGDNDQIEDVEGL